MQKTLIFRGGMCVRNMASSNEERIPSAREIDRAEALMARDYKGLKNFDANAVIEIYKVEKTESLNAKDFDL